MLGKIAIFFILSIFTLNAAEITGNYKFHGFDPYKNQNYSGKAFITKKDKVYEARWELNGEIYTGTGLQYGDLLSFIFKSPKNSEKEKYGLQVYNIEGDTLTGTWVLIGESKIGTETLQKL